MILPKTTSLLIALAAVTSSVSAQCYYAAGKLASSNYVPCGSTGNGQQQSCCHLGDNCLVDGVCFSLSTHMTYIAGCTDSNYQDGTCGAQTCNKNSQIQGIAMPCKQGTWQCCTGTGQRGDDPAQTDPSSCPCDNNAEPVIQGPTGFALTAILPQNANGQIALVNSGGQTTAFIPVPTPSSSAAATTSSSQTTTPSSSSSSTSSPSNSPATSTTPSSTNGASSPSSGPATSASSTNSATSSSSTSSASTSSDSGGTNLRLILGITIPVIIILLGVAGFFGYRHWRRRQEDRDDFVVGGWDPFRHQPENRRGSRSSAVWDNSYNAPGMAGYNAVAPDDRVAEAVRQNAEAHRNHYRSDSGGLRPMSDMGGLAPWKANT